MNTFMQLNEIQPKKEVYKNYKRTEKCFRKFDVMLLKKYILFLFVWKSYKDTVQIKSFT